MLEYKGCHNHRFSKACLGSKGDFAFSKNGSFSIVCVGEGADRRLVSIPKPFSEDVWGCAKRAPCAYHRIFPSIPRADASQKGHEVMSGLEIESKKSASAIESFRPPRRERAGKFARGSLVTTRIGKRKGKMKTL